MPEKISILKESGETLNSNVVSIFTIPDSGKKYIITTENAVDPHGLTVLHVSEVNDNNLTKVATDEEWNSIKTIMRSIISGNAGSYQYAPLIAEAKAEGQYSRDISVSSSASKQMVDNYAAGRELLKQEEAPVEQATESLEPAPEGSTIFPENGEKNVDAEVSPGIEEVEQPVEASPSPVQETPAEPAPVAQEVPAEPAPVAETAAPVEPAPVVEQPVVETAPVAEPVQETPVVEEVTPVVVQPEATTVEVSNENGTPAVEVTTEANDVPAVTINFNSTPSFDPNASLDEVIVAAQNVFVEGVNNLVQTITEKLYRDLHTKEAELNEREARLEERERLINDQMANFINSLSGQLQVAQTPVEQTVPQEYVALETPAVEQPVEAAPVEVPAQEVPAEPVPVAETAAPVDAPVEQPADASGETVQTPVVV